MPHQVLPRGVSSRAGADQIARTLRGSSRTEAQAEAERVDIAWDVLGSAEECAVYSQPRDEPVELVREELWIAGSGGSLGAVGPANGWNLNASSRAAAVSTIRLLVAEPSPTARRVAAGRVPRLPLWSTSGSSDIRWG